ncbi:PrsW family intramembrane metalloprotease [Streptomyces cavernicola]|uniref:PrsW family intramembrane metalloprotease n=1 Tax=Streptomyces cavernicola TaxID=3043613 RepID=A0ABT6S3A2_9ACTN|nr:PrsW family intramembrane metalloprotease [Streptomyces sp. B-S-A6]MDI3402571.1 PrsW family intramembrane metalloprotease [Streptomyces sp. B-S-A6]
MTLAPLPHAPQSGTSWWRRSFKRRHSVKLWTLGTLLALSGLVILALVREETGTEGFLVGLGLATLPVPLLTAAFRWLDRVEPGPWRNLFFSFAWGACAAALIAIVANSFATRWIETATADPAGADAWGATVIAPVVEESAKAAAVLLVFLFRRREFTGIVDGVVIAGVTATGFAFTENILYLGTAYGTDEASGITGLALDSVTAATFFVRIVMSPFAHPLFTVLTGIGFGLAARAAHRRRVRRFLLPLLGLVLAMAMHAIWNGSAVFGGFGFLFVYVGLMVPAFALLTWLTIWTRQRELRTIRTELPVYAAAGWIGPLEAYALSSMRARGLARDHAAYIGGPSAARTVAEYEAYATSLAFLRHRGRSGRAGPEFVSRERELLDEIWRRRETARPALAHAARATAPPIPAPRPHPYAYPYAPPYAPPYAYAQPHLTYVPSPAAHGPHAYAPYAPAHNPYRSG